MLTSTRREKLPFLLLFFAFFLPPRVSQNWWKFFSNSFASPSGLLPVPSPPLFSFLRLSSWWRSCQLENSRTRELKFFFSSSPLFFSSSPVKSTRELVKYNSSFPSLLFSSLLITHQSHPLYKMVCCQFPLISTSIIS